MRSYAGRWGEAPAWVIRVENYSTTSLCCIMYREPAGLKLLRGSLLM